MCDAVSRHVWLHVYDVPVTALPRAFCYSVPWKPFACSMRPGNYVVDSYLLVGCICCCDPGYLIARFTFSGPTPAFAPCYSMSHSTYETDFLLLPWHDLSMALTSVGAICSSLSLQALLLALQFPQDGAQDQQQLQSRSSSATDG